MREIIVRSLTSGDWLNRDCCVTEVMRQGELITRIMRRCTYHVESRITMLTMSDSIQWAQNIDPVPPRQVYVTKDLDPETGRERVIYKILGHFYAVSNREVICIGYRHILEMAVEDDETVCET